MCKNTNQKTFKFKVIETLKDENNEEYTSSYRFKTTKDITEKFDIPRNSIYYVMNNRKSYKYSHLIILRINEPAIHTIRLDN